LTAVSLFLRVTNSFSMGGLLSSFRG
jgi:hypothetical protein